MNFKKALATGAVVAAFAMAAVPAFAWHWMSDDDYTLKQKSYLKVKTVNTVNTGNVMAAGDDVKGGFQKSGDGFNVTEVTNIVNTATVPCDCVDGYVYIKQKSYLKVKTENTVNTGNVMAAGDDVKGGFQKSGDGGNMTLVTNVVNTVGEETL